MKNQQGIVCPNCGQKAQISRSGLGCYHIKCDCNIQDLQLTLEQTAVYLEVEHTAVKSLAKSLFISDAPV